MYFRKSSLVAVAVLCSLFMGQHLADARKKEPPVKKILFVPHDNRPISEKQTVDVVEKLGYDVVVPPEQLLGNREDLGHPNELWKWLDTTVAAAAKEKNEEVQAVVVSSDSMLYGSLVGSRKHVYSQKEVLERAERFHRFHEKYPDVPLYVFSSIMRTPCSGEASGHMEPEYYRSYGADIFRYTALKDKAEVEGLDRREKKELAFLQLLVPKKSMEDWISRRSKNMEANKYLVRLARQNTFRFLLVGRDDNAPYSQTHMENRHLAESSKGISPTVYCSMAGIDEAGMLLLARSINEKEKELPGVFVRYNWGAGAYTVPSYSDEKIGKSIDAAIGVAGGIRVESPENADLILAVNTNPNGKTYEAAERSNDGQSREGTEYFADLVEEYLSRGYPVAIADVAYANGSDNALMEQLRSRKMLFRLNGYAGWNTPTNSSGFAIGAGLLMKKMDREAVDDLLITRYLDDWAYQANVRNTVARQLSWLSGDGVYGRLDSKQDSVSTRTTKFLSRFVRDNLPGMDTFEEMDVTFPWNRMFEADIFHSSVKDAFLIKATGNNKNNKK